MPNVRLKADMVVAYADTYVTSDDGSGRKFITLEVGDMLRTADGSEHRLYSEVKLRLPTDTAEKIAKKLLDTLRTIPPREHMKLGDAMASPSQATVPQPDSGRQP